MRFYIILLVAIATLVVAIQSKSIKKRNCNETDLPMTKRCRRQLRILKDVGKLDGVKDEARKRRTHKNKRRKKGGKKRKFPLIEPDFNIDYQGLFNNNQEPWLPPQPGPTLITPPEADPAFITVQTEVRIKAKKLYKNNLFKRNTDESASFMSKKFEKSYTLIGNYGFHSPRVELHGYGVLVKDPGQDSHYACSESIENVDDIPTDGSPWVAVIERGFCDFFYKIRMAKLHNASAVIIYNHIESDELPIMNTVGTRIPSVIIHKQDGEELVKILQSGKDVFLNISLDAPSTPASPKAANPETTTQFFTSTSSAFKIETTFMRVLLHVCILLTILTTV